MLSPDLFFPYNDIMMQNLEEYPRIKVEEHNVHHLRYAAALLDIFEEETRKKRFEMKSRKVKVMVVSPSSPTHQHL